MRGNGARPGGWQGLRMLMDDVALPDAVLLDATLQSFSVHADVVATIRCVADEPALPIILMSAEVHDEMLEGGLAAGCNDYVRKPVAPRELLARVRTQMRLRRVFRLGQEATLLHRLLPSSVVERVTAGDTVADEHENVSVLFTDVVGFTEMSARTDAPAVLAFLNVMFDMFDTLADRHGVFKVATIGARPRLEPAAARGVILPSRERARPG